MALTKRTTRVVARRATNCGFALRIALDLLDRSGGGEFAGSARRR